MLAVVQFPIVDGRLFCGFDRLSKPAWQSLDLDRTRDEHAKSFVRRFGTARREHDFDLVPAPWRDDASYISAKWAVRMFGKPVRHDLGIIGEKGPHNKRPFWFWTYRAPDPETDLCFAPAFRRLHSDGISVVRVDVGFWLFGATKIDGTDIHSLVRDLLALETEVGNRLAEPRRHALGLQGKSLARHYSQSTRIGFGPPTEQEDKLVRHGGLAVFLDDRIGAEHLPNKPTWFRPMGKHLGTPKLASFPKDASVVSEQTAGALKLAYTEEKIWFKVPGIAQQKLEQAKPTQVWMIRGAPPVSREAAAPSRGIRQCLVRLHSDRHGLKELVSLADEEKIHFDAKTRSGTIFSVYLMGLFKRVLLGTNYGANQAELQQIITLYDRSNGGSERLTLEQHINRLPLARGDVEKLLRQINSLPHDERRRAEGLFSNFFRR